MASKKLTNQAWNNALGANEAAQGTLASNTNQLQPLIGQYLGQANSIFPGLQSGWQGITSSGGFQPGVVSGLTGQLNSINAGLSPDQLGFLNNTSQGFTQTGGFNQNAMNSLTGGYQNLINTGGLSDTDAQSMRDQAANAAQSAYSTSAAQAKRMTGTTGVSQGPALAQLARQSGEAGAQATNNANANIAQIRQQGTESGLAGYGQLNTALANNALQALGLYGQTNLQNANQSAQAQLGQLGLQTGLQESMAGNSIAGMQGLQGLYGSQLTQGNTLMNQLLQSQALEEQSLLGGNNILASLGLGATSNLGALQGLMGGLGSLGMGVGGVLTGIGKLGSGDVSGG